MWLALVSGVHPGVILEDSISFGPWRLRMQSKEVVPDVQIHNILADTAAEAQDVAKAQDVRAVEWEMKANGKYNPAN